MQQPVSCRVSVHHWQHTEPSLLLLLLLLLLLRLTCGFTGSLGRRMACSSAILGLFFSTSESYISNLADGRVPDEACTVAAGGCGSLSQGWSVLHVMLAVSS
jgi:hypothetical protein